MFWLSIAQRSEAFDPITTNRRPWAKVKKFWQFCRFYGDYQATPPSLRRQFIIDRAQSRHPAKSCSTQLQ
ncbi:MULTISPECIES: hypothetical protein [Cyanophyceae]|uniref:hypothetical protein n=1 Tax=Cyanophyceae TaxID=3028117 RepID=UPI001683BED2|nr:MULTISPECIES: hypothetical protein [Cyanophyceae]MBD1915423.1 hypothetical protein [Phormidium sp. FACHB-77]MBD2032424.1 hypothetical protein [Phormidium sp. FACHB-322]MBD2052595.1 hypothetical protein [Leptolyngbya sp. FACHB-60]